MRSKKGVVIMLVSQGTSNPVIGLPHHKSSLNLRPNPIELNLQKMDTPVYLPILSPKPVHLDMSVDTSFWGDHDLKVIWQSIVGHKYDQDINRYINELTTNGYTSKQKQDIYQLLFPFTKLDVIPEIDRRVLIEILQDPKCYVGQKNRLE